MHHLSTVFISHVLYSLPLVSVQGAPFVEDYFATAYSECNFDAKKPSGVCPDSALGRNDTLSNIQLLHGQRMDGKDLLT